VVVTCWFEPNNPADPANKLNPNNPVNPTDQFNPNHPLHPANRFNPETPFESLHSSRSHDFRVKRCTQGARGGERATVCWRGHTRSGKFAREGKVTKVKTESPERCSHYVTKKTLRVPLVQIDRRDDGEPSSP